MMYIISAIEDTTPPDPSFFFGYIGVACALVFASNI